MSVVIRCNKCKTEEQYSVEGEGKFYGIHLSLGKDQPQTRGHLCPPRARETCRELNLPPPHEFQPARKPYRSE